MHAAEKKKALMAQRVLCILYKKNLKMQIKILSNVPSYPETRGEPPTTPAKEIAHYGTGQFGKHLWKNYSVGTRTLFVCRFVL